MATGTRGTTQYKLSLTQRSNTLPPIASGLCNPAPENAELIAWVGSGLSIEENKGLNMFSS